MNVKSAWTTGPLVLLVIVSLGALGFHASVGATQVLSAPSSSSHLTPATCSYPATQYADAEQGGSGSAVAGPFPINAGDLLIVIAQAWLPNSGTTPMTVSDTVNSYANPVADVTHFAGGFKSTTDVWTATASTTASLSITVTALNSPSYTTIEAWDILGGATLAEGTPAFGGASVTASVTNGLCALVVGGDSSLGSASNIPSWTSDGVSTALSIVNTAWEFNAATGPTTSATDSFTASGGPYSTLTLVSITPTGPPPATAPNSLVATPISGTEIDLAWGNPAGESLVDSTVYLYNGAGCGGSATSYDIGTVATSYPATSLTLGTTYSFTVTASNATGEGPPSNCATASTLNVATAPSNLAAFPETSTSLGVTWTNPAGETLVDNFVWLYSAGCAALLNHFDQGVVTTHATLGTLTADTGYCVTVSAVNGTGESLPTTPFINTSTYFAAPSAPLQIHTFNLSDSDIEVTWTQPASHAGLSNYSVAWGTVNGTWTTWASLGGTNTSFNATGLSPLTTYFFLVIAYTNGGHALGVVHSNVTQAFIPPPLPPPPPPGGVDVVIEAAIIALIALFCLFVVLGSKRSS